MSPFCGATDTPVSDFWWCLLWVSKPEWVLPYSSLVEAYVLCYMFPEIHLWCDTCCPFGGQHGSWAVSSTYLWGIGGTWNRELSCCRLQCEIRQMIYWLSYPSLAAIPIFNRLEEMRFYGLACKAILIILILTCHTKRIICTVINQIHIEVIFVIIRNVHVNVKRRGVKRRNVDMKDLFKDKERIQNQISRSWLLFGVRQWLKVTTKNYCNIFLPQIDKKSSSRVYMKY